MGAHVPNARHPYEHASVNGVASPPAVHVMGLCRQRLTEGLSVTWSQAWVQVEPYA